ncbi:hypothetical protein ACFL6Z_12650 [Pseudomonadota bacterium]|uniref:hypothetical protein n=1 Tax=unclassified Shewanella TaxID=196818 RepID=UPI000C830EB7|nr:MULTISPECIES: hypothetical protein [unclassified Shewanella]PMG31263.1 hypothetical protein BCU94_09030 [Shewanella sp. 10N.286.52.C2]PMI03447.1 hypothetical protein BCU55_00420 [Shewanella sp. 10N.286.48.A6]
MVDRKAIKILMETYWHPKDGWSKSTPSEADFKYALDAGVMFPPETVTHDSIIKRARTAIDNTSKERVVDAFVSSLVSRRLDLRSALGSFASGLNLPKHESTNSIACEVCGSYACGKEEDLNVLNFERHKFGGVRHLDPLYIALDLELFNVTVIEAPNEEATEILRSLVYELRNIPSNRLSDAPKALASKLKSNNNERTGIISTFGYCGILTPPGIKPLYQQYVPVKNREYSSYSKSDWPFPSDLWRPEYGVNQDAVEFWFGEYVS